MKDENNSIINNIMIGTERIVDDYKYEPMTEYEILKVGIEKYISRPCISTCKRLWDLNISTFESSANNNGGWITILYDYLSNENKDIFNRCLKDNVFGYSNEISYKRSYGIYVLGANSEEEVESKLLELTSIFKMQDIKEGVYSRENFLAFICRCCTFSIEDNGEIIRTFDFNKMEKSFEEYLNEHGAIYSKDEDKVYLNNYYYQKHLQYLRYIEEKIKQ